MPPREIYLYITLLVAADSVNQAVEVSRSTVDLLDADLIHVEPQGYHSEEFRYWIDISFTRKTCSTGYGIDLAREEVNSVVALLGLANGHAERWNNGSFTTIEDDCKLPSQAAVLFPECRFYHLMGSADMSPMDMD
ncbi:hypothetical protein [Actinopolyspora halophila]|uniref:hypothetical protein n=1 Tax=Actinopolyspora halophila TaxID=1850 RepID=UPI0012F7CFEC|nr:hypothetical protein [Actinopolyspora halophila]